MTSTTAFAVLALSLFLNMFVTTLVQARARMSTLAFARPEDAAHWGGSVDDAPVARLAQAALRNDLENIPWFLVLVATLLALHAAPIVALAYGGVFLGARVMHTVCYLQPRQPLRNRAYLVGVTVNLLIAGHVAVLAVRSIFAV